MNASKFDFINSICPGVLFENARGNKLLSAVPMVKSATLEGFVTWIAKVCQQFNYESIKSNVVTEWRCHLEQYLKLYFVSYLDFACPTSVLSGM